MKQFSPSPFRVLALCCAALSFLPLTVAATNDAAKAPETAKVATPPEPFVFERSLQNFTRAEYANAVEQLLLAYEAQTKRSLRPGKQGRVGLKIYSESGPGLATPLPLVEAVIEALERRGYEKSKIFLVGLNQYSLRSCGFLPNLSKRQSDFGEHKVYVLESGRFYDTEWFYDSPLPDRFSPAFLKRQKTAERPQFEADDDRKSFLATPLFFDADFWINLPVFSDHETLGVNGALVNATLWNASNTQRFFKSASNAAAAVAEMAAIPELRESWALTIASLERFQFIGGPVFNSLYTRSENRLWLSADPVLLDALMFERINTARRQAGFQPIDDEQRKLIDYAGRLGVGTSDTALVHWMR